MTPFRNSLVLLFFAHLTAIPVQSQEARVPLCGSSSINDPATMERAWQSTLAKYPDLRRMGKGTEVQREFVLGVVDTFWVFNFTSVTFDRVPAELMAVGSVTYIWVAAGELQNGHIDSATVNELLDALEVRTPQGSRDTAKGIVVLDRQFFGDPPNINSSFVKGAGDGKTHFLVCDIKDGWTTGSTAGYIAGFFFNVDVDGSFPTSNRRDMLYIDSYPGIYFNGTRDFDESLNTLSHEFQHLIHWNYDPSEISFFNEGLSEYASYLCGFGLRSPRGYFDGYNVPLLGWSSVLDDYSRAALWTLYLSEQYGDIFIRNLVQNPSAGTAGFDSALDQSGLNANFASTVRNFHIANILRDRRVNPAYGYRDSLTVAGGPVALRRVLGSNISGSRTGLAPLAADYLRFFAAETLQTTITGTLGALSIKGLQINDAGLAATDLTVGVPFQTTYGGSQRSEFIAVVQNSNASGAATYNYTSTGVSRTSSVFELAHDDGGTHSAPNMLLQANDTVLVRFEGIEGGIIDSMALWFASLGTARLLLRDYNQQYDFVNQPLSGFGGKSKMFNPLSFSVTDTGFMKTVIPLRQLAISSAPDFVVEVIYNTAVHPMLRRDTSQAIVRSYLSLSSQPTAGRVIYQSFGDFYVRVYLSPGGENPPIPIPLGFALLQNYPNPFNAGTVITYDLPARSRVRLAVYDLLGREVAVLKDGEEDAQRYTVAFDASRMSSGVYFFKLTTPTFIETKKMVLVR